MFLKRVYQIRNKRHGHDDSGAYRRLQDFLADRLPNIPLRRWQHLAKSQREVKRRVRNGTKVLIGPRSVRCFVWHNRKIDLFLLIHFAYLPFRAKLGAAYAADNVVSSSEMRKNNPSQAVNGFVQEDKLLVPAHNANYNTLNLNGLRRRDDRGHGVIGRL